MTTKSIYRRRLILGLGLALPLFLAGCMMPTGWNCGEDRACATGKCGGICDWFHGHFDKCATIPAGAIPPPIGTHTNEIAARQVAKAEVDQFVVYLYEWYGDTANLGPFGSRHIERMAVRLPHVTQTVVIEPDGDAGLNEARRVTLIAYLEKHGNPNAGARVFIGLPQAEGLYGDESERIYRQMILPQGNANNYSNRGATQGNNSGGSSFGGTGLGGY
jgi:hypothetical protein